MIRLRVLDNGVVPLKIDEDSMKRLSIGNLVFNTYADYLGEYVVKPRFVDQVLPTDNLHMTDDVTVEAIEVARTSNAAGGKTVYIGIE